MANNTVMIEATINELQDKMDHGELTAKELVYFYLKRVANYDKKGVAINSVLEINPDAVHIAEVLDLERQEKGPRSLLHGIPVIVKDNIDTHDKMHTSAGSVALAGSYAKADAFFVKKLRDAGAIILGKANMTEWANFISDHMTSGYSSRGGQVLNPYGPGKFDVGGSSSGSGASVASNFTVVAIGTETSGSILSPASANGIVGIKPTVGLISRTGVIPISFSQDTAGPMARTVKDAAILLNVLAGHDEADPITSVGEKEKPEDYTKFLEKEGLKGARIGVPRERFFEEFPEVPRAVIDEAIQKLTELGAEVIDPVVIPKADAEENIDVMVHEFKPALNAYLGQLDATVPIHSLEDAMVYNLKHSDVALKYGQAMFEMSERTSGSLTESDYVESRLADLDYACSNGIDKVMADHNLDALVFPNNYGAGIAAKAGYPSITVPAGYSTEGEPVGLTFTAKAYSEPQLIKFAYAFEQATKHRKAPNLDE